MMFWRLPPHVLLTAVVAAGLGGFIYGYNIGVYSGAILEIQSALDLSDSQLGDLIALFDFAEIFGVLLSILADRYGRRRTLLVAAVFMTLAPLLPLADGSFATLLAARALSGVAAGYIFVVALIYVAEVSKPALKAPLSSLIMVAVSAGYMAELVLNAELIEGHHWRLAVAAGAIPATLQFIGLLFMRESPVFFRLIGDQTQARAACEHFGLEINLEDLRNDPKPGLAAMLHALKYANTRRQIYVGLLIVVAGTLAGHGTIISYGPLVLDYFGETDATRALFLLAIYSLVGLFFSLVALIPIRRGHTQLLLWASLATMGVAQLLIGVSSGAVAIALLGVLQVAFSFGLRTTVFQILPRLFDDATRAVGVAMLNLIFILLAAITHEMTPGLLSENGQMFFVGSGVLALVLAVGCQRLRLDR